MTGPAAGPASSQAAGPTGPSRAAGPTGPNSSSVPASPASSEAASPAGPNASSEPTVPASSEAASPTGSSRAAGAPSGVASASSTGRGGPLDGRRILLPRVKDEDALAVALRAAGAEVDTIEATRAIAGPSEPRARAEAALATGAYVWLIVSSPRALDYVDLTGLPAGTGLAVVGPATARRVARVIGRRADLVAGGSSAALLELAPLSNGPAPGAAGAARRILLPGSALRSTTLVDGLTAVGWEVDAVPVYTMESLSPAELPDGFARRWSDGVFDAVVLTAGSSSRALAELVGPPPVSTRVVALGRPTAASAGEAGFVVDAVAASPTPPGVRAAAIAALFP